MADDNGDAPKVDQLIITLQRNPWKVTVDGLVEDLNLALAMVNEVQRTLDVKWRAGAAMEMQAEQRKNVMENERVQQLLNRTRVKQ